LDANDAAVEVGFTGAKSESNPGPAARVPYKFEVFIVSQNKTEHDTLKNSKCDHVLKEKYAIGFG
jgi:hypothetical protein